MAWLVRTWLIRTTLVCCVAVMSSCGNQQQVLQNFNVYGGTHRTNNFEANGTFTASFTFTEKAQLVKYDKTAKLPGAIALPVPASFSTSYIPTSDGFVVRVTDKIVQWQSTLDGNALVAAALCGDQSDNVYAVATDGAVYAFAADGKRRWKVPMFPTDAVYSNPLLVNDGLVVACSNGQIAKLGSDGKILWQHRSALAPTKTLAEDEQENIVVLLSHDTPGATDTVLALAANGAVRWKRAVPNVRLLHSPACANGLIVAVGLLDSAAVRVPVLCAFKPDGTPAWRKDLLVTPTGIAVNGSMVVVAGTKLGIASPVAAVMAFSLQGKELWRKGFENMQIVSVPMISKEIISVIGIQEKASGIYYLKHDGTFSSVFSISDMPAMLLQPVVDYDGNMVFAMTEDLGTVRVGRSPAQKLLPY